MEKSLKMSSQQTIKERFKAVVSVHLILIKDNCVLLYLRQNTGFGDGLYSVIAGHIDGDETVTQAMIRESYEEAGIIVKPEDLEINCVMHRKTSDREIIDYFMILHKWENVIENLEPHKCAELRFFDLKDLPNNMVPYVKEGIRCSLNNIKFTEFGWKEVKL